MCEGAIIGKQKSIHKIESQIWVKNVAINEGITEISNNVHNSAGSLLKFFIEIEILQHVKNYYFLNVGCV